MTVRMSRWMFTRLRSIITRSLTVTSKICNGSTPTYIIPTCLMLRIPVASASCFRSGWLSKSSVSKPFSKSSSPKIGKITLWRNELQPWYRLLKYSFNNSLFMGLFFTWWFLIQWLPRLAYFLHGLQVCQFLALESRQYLVALWQKDVNPALLILDQWPILFW